MKKETYALIDREKNEKRKRENRRLIRIYIGIVLILVFLFYFIGGKTWKTGYLQTIQEKELEKRTLIRITENDINWNKIENLQIFSNPRFENRNIILPRDTGKYSFLIENTLNNDITYSIKMNEINEYNINMKYKLKIDNIYIVGNKDTWAEVKDLNIEDITATKNSANTYTLEWLWEDANNDTEIGKQLYATYKLQIKIEPKRK